MQSRTIKRIIQNREKTYTARRERLLGIAIIKITVTKLPFEHEIRVYNIQDVQQLVQVIEYGCPDFSQSLSGLLGIIWSLPDKAAADLHLQDWIARAEASGIRILKDFAKTLSTHKPGILAYWDHRISTGPLEGTNNKIKTLQRQAYGFRDQTFFMLRIYALHTTRYELLG